MHYIATTMPFPPFFVKQTFIFSPRPSHATADFHSCSVHLSAISVTIELCREITPIASRGLLLMSHRSSGSRLFVLTASSQLCNSVLSWFTRNGASEKASFHSNAENSCLSGSRVITCTKRTSTHRRSVFKCLKYI